MDLPQSSYVPINDFLIRNPLERRGSVREIKSYRNDRHLEHPENAMRCSKMVEVVEQEDHYDYSPWEIYQRRK